jgi:hypothetical protein
MNNRPGQGPPWPRRARAAVAIAATAIATAAMLAACSSPSSTVSGRSPGAGGAAGSPSAASFASCIRSHGVPDYPDPGRNAGPNGQSMQQFAQELGISVSRLRAALDACANLNPKLHAPAGQPLTAQEEQDYLRAAACMRSHGFAIPDPSFAGGHASFALPSGIHTTSPQFVHALQTCQKLIPAGLPYSGSD